MVQIVLIGIARGRGVGVAVRSVASGSLLSVLLFYLAPLPILIAALGWSHWAALIAAVVASAGLAAVFGAVLLPRLPARHRPARLVARLSRAAGAAGATAAGETLEWYPVGHLVLWAAILGALVVIVAILNFGIDVETLPRDAAQRASSACCARRPAARPMRRSCCPALPTPHRLLDLLVARLPPAAAVLTTLTNVVNLWLAGAIVHISGRLQRPWPIFRRCVSRLTRRRCSARRGRRLVPARHLPASSSGVLGCEPADGLCDPRFAVLHAITRGISGRGLHARRHLRRRRCCSAGRVLMMTLLGLADTAFDFAAGRAQARPACRSRVSLIVSNRIQPTDNGETTMEVILLERVAKLGQMGDVVRVKDGFARNFLLPKGKALRATKANKSKFEGMKVELEAKNLQAKGEADKSRRQARRQELHRDRARPPKPASSTARCRRATSPSS